MPNEEQGSFPLGFTFGLLAGAAGFFIFGTERGKQARAEFAKQWHKAHTSMAKNPDLVVPTLREAFTTAIAAVTEEQTKKIKRATKPRVKKQTFSGT
ncbi:MAG: hypothetical protein O2840_05030 [bacterium]|nr:hypothetical protein [bacterium]